MFNFLKLYNFIFRRSLNIDYGEGVYPPDNFNGTWEVFWPNGTLKFRSDYVDGLENGAYLCLWDNGNVCQEGRYIKGQCVGLWNDYLEDGEKYKMTEYQDSDNFKITWLDSSGNPEKFDRYVNGVKQ